MLAGRDAERPTMCDSIQPVAIDVAYKVFLLAEESENATVAGKGGSVVAAGFPQQSCLVVNHTVDFCPTIRTPVEAVIVSVFHFSFSFWLDTVFKLPKLLAV
jgi:hypothetical protein